MIYILNKSGMLIVLTKSLLLLSLFQNLNDNNLKTRMEWRGLPSALQKSVG